MWRALFSSRTVRYAATECLPKAIPPSSESLAYGEDIYIKEEYRGLGFGSRFIEFVGERYPDAVLRLEVEQENERAVAVYEKKGFSVLPYMEMKK